MRTILFISLSITLLLSLACTKEVDFTEGNIIGNVNLFTDANLATTESGMTVTVEGTSISALTDATGRFQLVDVPFGTYTLVYTKANFGTFKRSNLLHENAPTFMTGSNSLSEVSTTEISSASNAISGDTSIITLSTSPAASITDEKQYRVFYSSDMAVSNTNFEHSNDARLSANATPYLHKVLFTDLISMGYQSGQTVYCKVYGDSYFSNEYSENGVIVYPNLNAVTSTTMTIVIP